MSCWVTASWRAGGWPWAQHPAHSLLAPLQAGTGKGHFALSRGTGRAASLPFLPACFPPQGFFVCSFHCPHSLQIEKAVGFKLSILRKSPKMGGRLVLALSLWLCGSHQQRDLGCRICPWLTPICSRAALGEGGQQGHPETGKGPL